MVNTYAVRETARQIDSELYLPVGATILAGATTITLTQLSVLATNTATGAELSTLAGVTAGVVAASKAVVVDASKDAASFGFLRAAQVVKQQGAPTSINTAGATTLTIAQLLTGILVIDCNGAGRTVTFPTAALVVPGVRGAAVGDVLEVRIINSSDAAESITLAEGAGGTWDANFLALKTIVQNASRTCYLRITNIGAATEAYVLY